MTYRILIVALILVCTACVAKGQHRLLLFDIALQRNNSQVSKPIVVDSLNVSENIPVFSPTSPMLFYLKKVEGGSEIFAFDYQSEKNESIITSTETLSALQLTPDGKFFSCLSTGAGGVVSLIKFPVEGGESSIVLEGLKIENYFWMDDNVLLIIQSGKPNSLGLLTLRPKKQIPIAQHVGATLAKASKMNTYAFVHKLSVDSWSIKIIQPDGSISILAETLPDAEVFTMTPEGALIQFREEKIHILWPGDKKWTVLVNQLGEVPGLSVNNAGDRMAVLVKDLQ